MIIIYEGPDGIGKNAFIEYQKMLLKNREVVVYEHGKDFDNSFVNWVKQIDKWRKDCAKDKAVLVSRCWLSEHIYAKTFKRTPRLSVYESELLTRWFKEQLGNRIVVVLPKNREVTFQQLKNRGDEEAVISTWNDIVDNYENLSEQYSRDDIDVIYI